jgi:ribosome assembly protein 1
VHLEKCLVDLEEIYCKIPIKASEPIINFRETVVWYNPLENKNSRYIEEIERKKNEQIKKEEM